MRTILRFAVPVNGGFLGQDPNGPLVPYKLAEGQNPHTLPLDGLPNAVAIFEMHASTVPREMVSWRRALRESLGGSAEAARVTALHDDLHEQLLGTARAAGVEPRAEWFMHEVSDTYTAWVALAGDLQRSKTIANLIILLLQAPSGYLPFDDLDCDADRIEAILDACYRAGERHRLGKALPSGG